MTRTTIQLYQTTLERLKDEKVIPQESYDVEINRLLNELKKLRGR